MTIKTQVQTLEGGNGFVVSKVNTETGKVSDAETHHALAPIERKELGRMLSQTVKGATNERRKWQTFLADVFASTKLDGFKGTGDKNTGKMAKELKAAVRSAEEAVVEAMVKDGTIKFAKTDNVQVAFQEFMTIIRDDKNYSNIKSYCTKYFAFCGATPATGAGMLVPQPVMVAQVAAVMTRGEPEKGYHVKLKAIKQALDDADNIPSDDATLALEEAKRLVSTLQGIVNHYAEMATTARGNAGEVAKGAVRDASKGPGANARRATDTKVDMGQHAPALV